MSKKSEEPTSEAPQDPGSESLEQRAARVNAEAAKVNAELAKQKEDDAATEAAKTYDPAKFIAIDHSGGGAFTITALRDLKIEHPTNRPFAERYIRVGDRTFEHVAEVNGVWAYRHLG